jgi:phage repressor protein C with HTH and peptisase S24 domain
MRLVGVISTTVLSLTLGLAASAYAQEQQKEEEKAKPAKQDEKKASPDKPSKTEKKAGEKQKDNAGHEEKATQQKNKDAKPEQGNERQQPQQSNEGQQPQQSNERQQPQHDEQAQPEQRTKGGGDHGGGRIPEDRYRAHFGQEHRFHVSQADYGRDRRFQYGGYTFGFVDEWPSNWLYTQDVFVIEIDGVYYLCNPTYPGVNIALSIAL